MIRHRNILIKKYFSVSLALFGVILCWASINSSFSTFNVFSVFFVLIVLLNIPKCILSPINVLFSYYGIWFVIAPLFASGYTQEQLLSYEYKVSIGLVMATFVFALYSIKLGEWLGNKVPSVQNLTILKKSELRYGIATLYFLSTAMVILIVYSSGGPAVWLDNPGDAFLNRGGSGHFVILSHFSSILLAFFCGYHSYKSRSLVSIIIFVFWLFLTSPVHGSKFQIILLLIISLLPWLRNVKTISLTSVCLAILFVCIFLLGMVFRGLNYSSFERVISVLNYFSTLHNLAISVRDFSPGELMTFFYPFQKFLTPFGLADHSMYYDMNHLLTDIYYPEAWEIRATEQWPVETDLYLNFYYIGGLPFLFIYMSFIGYFHAFALKISSIGGALVSLLMTVFMISHLRGSLYNHTDFYMLPYFILIYFLLRRYGMKRDCYGN